MTRPYLAMLLAGVLAGAAATAAIAQSSEPTPAPPPYPDDTVDFELLAPSIWRVDEPAWDCGEAYPRQPFYDGAEVAADGRVWFLDQLRGVRELGACPIVEPRPSFGIRDQALGPDGTLWLLDGDRLWSWDEEGWRVRLEGFNQPGRIDDGAGGYSYSTDCEASTCYLSVDVAPDGTVWLAGSTLTAFDGTDTRDYSFGPSAIGVIGFDPDGRVWVRSDEELYLVDPTSAAASAPIAHQPSAAPSVAPAEDPLVSILAALAGEVAEVKTWSGVDWIARFDPVMHDDADAIRGLEAVLDAADVRAEDVTIATAIVERTPGNYTSVAALRTSETLAFDWLDAAIAAMAPQIERPLMEWDRVDDRSVVRVRDGTMPGVYPITFYPAADTVWVLQAERSLVAAILPQLPEQTGGPAPELRCDVLQAPFQQSFTTGDADRDREYLTHCVTCDQLLDLLRFAGVADTEAAESVLQERCGWTGAGG